MTSGSVRLDFSDENIESKQKFKHPYVILAHIAFRSAAVATYLLVSWFSSSFIISFLIILFLLSVDFWTVKNITGRLLVGLRWWNFVDSDGKSQWRFESKKGTEHCNSAEANIFWIALVVTPIVWIIFFMTAVIGLQFKWLLVVIMGASMSSANLFGYIRCRWHSRSEISSYFSKQFVKNIIFHSDNAATNIAR